MAEHVLYIELITITMKTDSRYDTKFVVAGAQALVAPLVIIMTTPGATNNDKVGMITLGFQW